MPDQEQLFAEIASLKQSLATQQRQNAELAVVNEQLHGEIEEHKRIEAGLRENLDALQGSEEKYKTLVETLPDAVIMADLTGHASFVSRRLLELHRAESVEEFMGKTAWDYLVPEDHKKGHEYYQKTLKDGITRSVELSFLRMDGTRFPSELSAALIKDASGKAVGIINVLRDISERKEAEQALKESERRFRNYFEQSLIGMGATTLNGHWIIANDRICEILGYSREELFQRTWPELTHPEDLAKDVEQFHRLLRNEIENYTLDKRFLRKDGSVVYTTIQIRAFHKEDGTIDHIVGLMEDITERKEAEEALRSSEERFRVAFEESPVGMVIGDKDGTIVQVNRTFCRITGYASEELVGWHVLNLTHPEDRELIIPSINKLFDGEIASFPLEKRYVAKDGRVFWVQTSTAGGHSADGKVAFALGVVEDISVRKQAEEALRRSEERFRSYFEQGLMGMAVSSADMRWLEVNDRFCEIVGCSKEEALQRKITDFIHPDDLEAFHRSHHQLHLGEIDHYTAERRYLLESGRVLYLNLFVKVFRSPEGAVDHGFALFEDITERKQAQEALQASEERFRAVVEDQTELVFRFNPEGIFTFVNGAFCRFCGKQSQELVGSKWQSVASPEDVPMIERQLSTMTSDNPIVVIENRVYSGLEKVHWMQFVNRGLYDQEGRLIETQTVARDITKLKLAQEALHKEHRTLKHLLQSSDHERQTIAYEIHDGLAQYLAGAIMQFDVYQHLLETKPNDAIKAYEGAMTLLRQGHFEARRLIAGVRPPVLDEAGVVEAIAHLINEQNRAKGPQIDFSSNVKFSRLIPILENAVYRICQEGLSNACKHSQSETVLICLRQQQDRLRIDIRDRGTGFDTNKVKDNCYGLVGIRERVRLLGGKCQIRSKVGKGTRILVELPLMEREE